MAKRKSKGRKSKKSSMNFGVISTIIFSILLTVLIYTESGYAGILLSDFFGGMFGIIKYVVPIGSFAVAIKMACKDDDGYISSKIFQYSLLLIFIAVILSAYEIYNGEINIEQNISEVVKDAYTLGENSIGGGALGTIAAVPLFKLFGKVGTIILSVGISLILFAVTFGIDISEIISNWIQSGVERRKERHEERMQARSEEGKKEEKKFVEKEKKQR
ncbi:MAG: DNA translocase FtsK 4TM domain-containing protein [Clostridia bacterium]